MLIEIDFDIFKPAKQKPNRFTERLNIMLGTKGATNSIGKSIMLMIIDFVFGGDDYIRLPNDVAKHKGDRGFRFAFKFRDAITRYYRSTKHSTIVTVSDENYELTDTFMSIADFRQSLSNAYGLKYIGLTWREVVGGTYLGFGSETMTNPHCRPQPTAVAGIVRVSVVCWDYVEHFPSFKKLWKPRKRQRRKLTWQRWLVAPTV